MRAIELRYLRSGNPASNIIPPSTTKIPRTRPIIAPLFARPKHSC